MTYHTIPLLFEQEGERLKRALQVMADAGLGGDVWEQTDDYGWELAGEFGGVKFDVHAEFSDAYAFGDEEEAGHSANVNVHACTEGGHVLPGFTPYNYTPDVWCDLRTEEGSTELADRLAGFEGLAGDLAEAIMDALRKEHGAHERVHESRR